MNFNLTETILVVLLTALFVTVVFQAIKLPVILGYLVAGALVGPHVLAWLPDTQAIKELAEFGIALLMFTIGLELSLTKLIALRYAVFVLGSLQVFISIFITTVIGLTFKMTLIESTVIGCIAAMSSTAIVIKQLAEQSELQSEHGFNAIGILLFQDLAVIPILILIASFSNAEHLLIFSNIFWALLKGTLAAAIIIGLGRWFLRPLFHITASTHTIELFTLSVLFVAIGAAWITQTMKMSYALGAFLAGIMLSETEFRHQIKMEIRPFKDVLLALFFVSVGMLVNVSIWLEAWPWILLLFIALTLGKTILITLLCRLSRYNWASAMRTGVILSEGGEFGFAILTLALNHHLLSNDYGQVILAALIMTFALAPILVHHNKKITLFLFPKFEKFVDME